MVSPLSLSSEPVNKTRDDHLEPVANVAMAGNFLLAPRSTIKRLAKKDKEDDISTEIPSWAEQYFDA